MADKTTVDAYLGSGSWNDWQTLQKDHLAAANASNEWNRWFSFGAEADLVWRCRDDIISLDVVGDDYAEALNTGSKGTIDQISKIRLAYRKSVDLLAGDNQIIDAIRTAGIPRSLTALNLKLLQEQSAIAKDAIAAARKAISIARGKTTKSETAACLDAADIILKAAFPEITLTAKIALGLGKWALGKYLLDLSEPPEDANAAVDSLLSFKTLRDYKAGLAHPAAQVLLNAEKILEGEISSANVWLAFHSAEIEVDKLQDQIADRKSLLVTLKGNIKNVEIKCRTTRRKLHNEAEVALLAAGYNLDPLYVNWR